MARSRPLRRHLRLPERRRSSDVAVPRLGDPRVQRQPSARRLPALAARGRPAARRDPGPAARHRVQPPAPHDQRRRQRRGGVPRRVRLGSRAHHGHRDARSHHRVREVPRSQVRSALATRVLRALRVLRRHRRERALLALHERHADPDPAPDHARDRRPGRRRPRGDRRRREHGGRRGTRRRVSIRRLARERARSGRHPRPRRAPADGRTPRRRPARESRRSRPPRDDRGIARALRRCDRRRRATFRGERDPGAGCGVLTIRPVHDRASPQGAGDHRADRRHAPLEGVDRRGQSGLGTAA